MEPAGAERHRRKPDRVSELARANQTPTILIASALERQAQQSLRTFAAFPIR